MDVNLCETSREHSYLVLEWIDGGAYGEIWKVVNKVTGNLFAAKEVLFRQDYTGEDCIVRENKAFQLLKHGNIINLQEFLVFPGKVWFVEELATAGSLQDAVVLHKALEDNDMVNLARQLVQALSHCHSRNVSHMDINPRNILLVLPLTLKLADFGQAMFTNNMVASGLDYLGDYRYLPPEVLSRKSYHPKAVDIWSVTCVVFYIFTLSHLFCGTSDCILEQQTRLSGLNEYMKSNSKLLKPARRFIKTVLKYDKHQRPVVNQLDQIADNVGLYSTLT